MILHTLSGFSLYEALHSNTIQTFFSFKIMISINLLHMQGANVLTHHVRFIPSVLHQHLYGHVIKDIGQYNITSINCDWAHMRGVELQKIFLYHKNPAIQFPLAGYLHLRFTSKVNTHMGTHARL